MKSTHFAWMTAAAVAIGCGAFAADAAAQDDWRSADCPHDCPQGYRHSGPVEGAPPPHPPRFGRQDEARAFGPQGRRPGPPPMSNRMFDALDADGDGLLSREEMRSGMGRVAPPAPGPESAPRHSGSEDGEPAPPR
jgi:hypothetical protein